MILIFSLLRADIFPMGDIGAIRTMERLYNNGEALDKGARSLESRNPGSHLEFSWQHGTSGE